ncbi:MAG: hypothetical protein J5962_01450 [Lachnospiraceae bacterium]|nr:hypothetical protein [Lachnospiraceae bacterium]
MNPTALFKIMELKRRFDKNHPKFGAFFKAAGKDALVEGSIITVSVQAPGKNEMVTNLKVTQDDLELMEEIKNIGTRMNQ